MPATRERLFSWKFSHPRDGAIVGTLNSKINPLNYVNIYVGFEILLGLHSENNMIGSRISALIVPAGFGTA